MTARPEPFPLAEAVAAVREMLGDGTADEVT